MAFFAAVIADSSWWPLMVEVVPVIISLVVIEGLLSVDNALAIAALAKHLPEKQKKLAVRLGLVGAYGFRVVALLLASFIIRNLWLKVAGAAYLIYLMASHFRKDSVIHGPGGPDHGLDDEDMHPGVKANVTRSFWSTVGAIQLMDLSLSVDNVVAAVAMSPKFWVVCTGVLIGILALMFLAGLSMRMIEKYPILEDAAFILIGYVGLLLLFEMLTHIDIGAAGKFVGIVLILGVAIFYSRQEGLRRALTPVLAATRLPMRIYAQLFVLPFLPFKWLLNSLRGARRSAAAGGE